MTARPDATCAVAGRGKLATHIVMAAYTFRASSLAAALDDAFWLQRTPTTQLEKGACCANPSR